jgi:flagellar assembly factor FliW
MDLAFVMINPFFVCKDYDIEIGDESALALEVGGPQDLEVYSIVVVPDDISKMTKNLKAPVLINTKNNRGMQVILDTDKYSVRHYILEELRRQEVLKDACSDEKKGSIDNNK